MGQRFARQEDFHFRLRGRAVPMLTISPVSKRRIWLAVIACVLFRFVTPTQLRHLRFIHFARWFVIRPNAFPHLDEAQPREDLQDGYLIFSTNFNGRWDEYIDAFVLLLRRGINWLWHSARSYPGAWPLLRFKRYIRYHQFPTHYYYNAYPEASVRDVLSALKLIRKLESFDRNAPKNDAVEFNEHYERLLSKVGNHVPTTGIDLSAQPAPHEYVQPIDD